MRSLRPLARRPAILTMAALLATGCIDGPFEHANPHDAAFALEMRIAGGADTLRAVGEITLYQLVSAPVVTGYTVVWSSSDPSRLGSSGLGRFIVTALPPAPAAVTVTAAIGANVTSRTVILVPAVP